MTATAEFNLRIRAFHPSDGTGPRLLCLPHAGGAANFFFPLSAAMAPGVEVLAAQYPGRQDRYTEAPFSNLEALAEDIFSVLDSLRDRPLALFGHSMGAVVAFEVARRLDRSGTPAAALFVSGRRGPSLLRSENTHQLSDAMLIAELKALGGTDLAFLDNEEVMRMVLPTLRCDFRAVETYLRSDAAPLSCPVVAMLGEEDPRVSPVDASTWSAETTGAFELRTFGGDHFYLVDHCQAIARIVSESLAESASVGGSS